MKTTSRSPGTFVKAAVLALMLATGLAPLAGCADIHPDNSPHSPTGHGR